MQLIAAMLNVCQCPYEEAQTYDAGTPEFKKNLNVAAEEFEKLHQRYRNYTAVCTPDCMNGNCFDDQGDTQKAMGIYNELLDHEGSNRNLKKLQHKTLQFKMEALNPQEPARLTGRSRSRRRMAEGEQSRKAAARIGLVRSNGNRRSLTRRSDDQRELAKKRAERYWRTARTSAQQINRFRSIYSDVSLSMIQRLDGKLVGRDRKPDSFETDRDSQSTFPGYSRPAQRIGADGNGREKRRRRSRRSSKISIRNARCRRNVSLALNLADKNDDPKAVSTARLYYAYVHSGARRNYEAAILGEICRTDRTEGRVDAHPSMRHISQWRRSSRPSTTPKAHRPENVRSRIRDRSCEFIIKRWPESDRRTTRACGPGHVQPREKAVERRTGMAKCRKLINLRRSPTCRDRLSGTATRRAAEPQEERPPKEQYQQWQTTGRTTSADRHRQDVDVIADGRLASRGTDGSEVFARRHSDQPRQRLPKAITVLTADPQSVVKAVTVEDEPSDRTRVQKRSSPLKSYNLLAPGLHRQRQARRSPRHHEKARNHRRRAAGADITDLYVGLGKIAQRRA